MTTSFKMANTDDLLEDLFADKDCLQAVPSSSTLGSTFDTSDSTTSSGTGQITDHREQLAILVASGKTKEFIGARLSQDDVKKLNEQEVEKFYKRYQAALASRVTDTLVDGFLKLTCKAVGMAVPIDSTEKLHDDLKDDYIIQQELSSSAGLLSLKCGRLMAVASAVLHIVNHMVITPTSSDDGEPSTDTAEAELM